jgi:HSP20 family protein
MKNQILANNDGFLFDPLFDLFAPVDLPEPRGFRSLDMKTDIKEEGNAYAMSIELPGVAKKDIAVSLNDGYLTVTAKVEDQTNEKDKKGNYIHRERFSGTASRSFYVGNIAEKDIKAAFDNGVLTLTFPKEVTKEIPSHKIEIQ